ncbi:hypothetical protein PTI98_004279 [Pleurotus ostreatus]|nr:hypothetical protein PTI98_004279 [Pleurotus ostreatus]
MAPRRKNRETTTQLPNGMLQTMFQASGKLLSPPSSCIFVLTFLAPTQVHDVSIDPPARRSTRNTLPPRNAQGDALPAPPSDTVPNGNIPAMAAAQTRAPSRRRRDGAHNATAAPAQPVASDSTQPAHSSNPANIQVEPGPAEPPPAGSSSLAIPQRHVTIAEPLEDDTENPFQSGTLRHDFATTLRRAPAPDSDEDIDLSNISDPDSPSRTSPLPSSPPVQAQAVATPRVRPRTFPVASRTPARTPGLPRAGPHSVNRSLRRRQRNGAAPSQSRGRFVASDVWAFVQREDDRWFCVFCQ